MFEVIALRRFNHDGAHYAEGQRFPMDDATFNAFAAIGLVAKAPKLKLPAKQ